MALIRPCTDLKNNDNKQYATFEEFKKEIFNKTEQALKEIEDGKGIPMDVAIAEMEAKYNFNE